MGNLDFSANADQLKELAAYMASQINVPTIGIGGGYAPIGTIISVMGTTAPQDYLACDGTVYNIADYPQLADYFESQFGESNHFGGNGTTTFAVPDLQGEFLRGTGTNSHANQGSGANVGEHQDSTQPAICYGSSTVRGIGSGYQWQNVDSYVDEIAATKVTGANDPGGAFYGTIRPTNTSVLYCIKAVVAGEVYSTEERVVGTWIDGKKIYQKTVLLPDFVNINSTEGVTVMSISQYNIDSLINCIYYSLPKNDTISTKVYKRVAYPLDTRIKDQDLVAEISGSNVWVCALTLQYTKTTDG